MAEAGADLIVGHHPHVLQPVDLIESKSPNGEIHKTVVAYSLGNFLFGRQEGARGRTLLLRTRFHLAPGAKRATLDAVDSLPLVVIPKKRILTLPQNF